MGVRLLKLRGLIFLPLLLAACQSLPAAEPVLAGAAAEGKALAESSCAACHAVGRYGASTRTAAPPFPAIVNQEGLTKETLSFWLKGAHNYPREMDFYLSDQEVDALVAYMLTLKDPHYKRPPD